MKSESEGDGMSLFTRTHLNVNNMGIGYEPQTRCFPDPSPIEMEIQRLVGFHLRRMTVGDVRFRPSLDGFGLA